MTRLRRTKVKETYLYQNEGPIQDIQFNVQRILRLNPTLTPAEALLEVQKEMLKNNPFIPPQGGRCIINTMLPVELLTHIFRLGVEMDWVDEGEDEKFQELTEGQDKGEKVKDDDGKEDDDGEEESKKRNPIGTGPGDVNMEVVEDAGDDLEWGSIPFEILVSHVCRHWREAAVTARELWSRIEFTSPLQWEMYETYLERAKAHPLTLNINGSRYNGFSARQILRIFDMLVPLASQWHRVYICMSRHAYMEYVLKRLHEIPAAPTLETIHMHDEEVCDGFIGLDPPVGLMKSPLTLPFHGNAPNLRSIDLRGVHVDWDAATPLFANLKQFNLAFHIERPSFKMFATYLRNAPRLELLELNTSGPCARHIPLPSPGYTPPIVEGRGGAEGVDPWAWHSYPIEVPSLRELSLSGHEPDYAHALAQAFFFPNLKSISLSYPDGDFTDTMMAYATPTQRGSSRRSVFQLIDSLQLFELDHVDTGARNAMLEALVGLKNLCLGDVNAYYGGLVRDFWEALYQNTLSVHKEKGEGSNKPVTKQEGVGSEANIPAKLLLPHLSTIQARGIDGRAIGMFVEGRKSLGLSLKTIMLHSESEVSYMDKRWLRTNVEELVYFVYPDEGEDADWDDDGFVDLSVSEESDDADRDRC
ncbi:hypothetical protein BKA70DRAFT_1265522 [Coprinopsis sp. MPI-PUGE-AT-0042]|nr:hypothetical protein BKA70DRAFT_1265522 [Coprinopsis sp. MPI-PUGE-AT-0042]